MRGGDLEMMRFCFKKGLIFFEMNTRWMLIRRQYNGTLQFENELGEIKNLLDKEVLTLWQARVWLVDLQTLGQAGDAIYHTTPADLSTYPTRWQEIANRRLIYVNAVFGVEEKFNKVNWQKFIEFKALEIGDENPPCPESVLAWVKKYRISKSITSLLPSVKSGKSRKEDERYAIFEDVIKAAFLNSQKLPIREIVNRISRRVILLNASKQPEEIVKKIAQSTIYRWVNNLRNDIADAARLGANVARNKYRVAHKHLKIAQILERVEIDNTPLDLIVIDELTKLVLGKPWLTLAIDVKSRMIVGFYLSFNTPSSHSVLQCLKQAVLPKEEILLKFDGFRNAWPAYGIPDLIALDNGMEFHSDALKKTCFEMAIQILFCPAATPWTKPFIERVFRTLAKGLIHTLPGTTFSNIIERGDYASEEEAVIDIKTLTHLITKWIVDIYHVTPHRGLGGNTPLAVWNESAKTRIIELPVNALEIEVMAGIPARRTLFHYGIELEGLHYNDKKLQEIRRISGTNLQLDIKFYEDQVEYIDVFDPFLKEYLRVEAVHDEYVKDLHRAAHRLARAQARKKFGDHFTIMQLLESRQDIELIVEQAIKSKKMADRKAAAGLSRLDSASILNGEKSKSRPKNRVKDEPPQTLDGGLDDDLPEINNINDKKDEE